VQKLGNRDRGKWRGIIEPGGGKGEKKTEEANSGHERNRPSWGTLRAGHGIRSKSLGGEKNEGGVN